MKPFVNYYRGSSILKISLLLVTLFFYAPFLFSEEKLPEFLLQKNGHSSFVKSVSFSPDGSLLVSANRDSTVKIWQVKSGELIKTLKGHSDSVYSVSFSPDGSLLASGSRDNTVKIWQVKSGEWIKTLKGNSDSVYSVSFSPDGSLLASGSRDNTVKIWQGEERRIDQNLKKAF